MPLSGSGITLSGLAHGNPGSHLYSLSPSAHYMSQVKGTDCKDIETPLIKAVLLKKQKCVYLYVDNLINVLTKCNTRIWVTLIVSI